jgi:hypothetical protein
VEVRPVMDQCAMIKESAQKLELAGTAV